MGGASTTSSRLSTSPAVSPVLRRFLWKDVRTLRNLWLGVAGVATLLLAAFTLGAGGAAEVALVTIPWCAGAIYALGATISLFAREREEHTDGFLLLLPRYERSLLAGKALAAAITSVALVPVVGLASFALAGGRVADLQFAASVSANGSLVMLEWFVWGTAVALLCPHPLLAAVIAIAAAALSAELAFAASSPQALSLWLARDHFAAPQRLLVVAAVAMLDVRLGLRWLDPRPARRRQASREQGPVIGAAFLQLPPAWPRAAIPGLSASVENFVGGPRTPMFLRLVWQSWREARLPMLAAVPAGLLLTSTVAIVGEGVSRAVGGVSLAPLGWLIVPALFGSLAYRADQRDRSYEFLHVRGARPGAVWASRHAVWLTAAIALAVAIQTAIVAIEAPKLWQSVETWRGALGNTGSSGFNTDPEALWHDVAAAWRRLLRGSLLGWSAIVAAYGCGQLCSMMIRSSIVSAFAAIFLSLLVAAWCALVELWQLPAVWFVGAIGLATLGATRAGCRGWLAERTCARRWLAPAAAMAIGVAFIGVTLPGARRAQLETVHSRHEQMELDQILAHWNANEQAEAHAVATEYKRMAVSIEGSRVAHKLPSPVDDANDSAFLEACQPEFDELARISLAPRYRVPSSATTENDDDVLLRLVTWLQDDASRHLDAADLPTALTRLVTARRIAAHGAQFRPSTHPLSADHAAGLARHESLLTSWSIASGQTAELLKIAVRQLEYCERLQPGFHERVVADYLRIRTLLLSGNLTADVLAAKTAERSPSGNILLAFAAQYFPGERGRAVEALRVLTEARLAYVHAISGGEDSDGHSARPVHRIDELRRLLHPQVDWSAGMSRTPRVAAKPAWRHANELGGFRRAVESGETSFVTSLLLSEGESLVDAKVAALDQLARRRAEIVRLALIAYRLDHGEYPENLLALATDIDPGQPYLDAGTLLDPYTGRPYVFRREGLSLPLLDQENLALATMIPARTPVMWSVGSTFVREADRWVAQSYGDDGRPVVVPAKDPARFPPSPYGEIPVHVATFYNTTEYGNRGPILVRLPD